MLIYKRFQDQYSPFQTTEIQHHMEEIKKLKEELEKLQVINSEREEKQKIIDELRKMVMDADTSKKSKLRSSYLALHYDSNSTEIKQLRAEVRSLKLDNENLRTENLMAKKSDNLKKLQKLREDLVNPKPEAINGPQSMFDELMGGNSKLKQKQTFGGAGSHNLISKGVLGRRPEVDRGMFVPPPTAERPVTRGSDIIQNAESDNKAHASRAKERDRDIQELDFTFSNSQNGAVGQKRSQSKDRSNKRVTFLSDTAISNETKETVVRIPTGNVTEPLHYSHQIATVTMNGPIEAAATSKGNGLSKPEKSRGRPKQSHLKTRAASKRSASLNNLTASRDIMKMSSNLIQKSRNLRQPIRY